ncbi:MAG TPA: alanine--tRNA ligase, partial [Rhodothermales bacterium]|nr:alanine--tRNA ligase [Rhodothermales bacterium]
MSTPRSSEQIRSDFLDFFRERGHEIVPGASLVPVGDPTLLFTNAGMNQFKDVFLGTGTRPYDRAADTQKCLRVSGKHNDLEEVGHDTYHHTLFEMLGNWSFGDYFKKKAIGWAWELLVGRWGLPPERLYATVHEGDERLGLDPVTEAADFWKSETGLNPDHIKFCRSKDNFWMMGDTGPCGPCSEIHIDLRPDEERARTPGIDLVNADDPRVMEIWNLVFIQYNALADDALEPLKARHVDTGMGFERVVAVLQGKSSNYDTDLFAPLLQRIADLSPRTEIEGYNEIKVDNDTERERIRIAMRVVADHIRTIAFATADGASPGNTGRGYVIRRILRRAVRYGYQTLGFREPFLHKLVEPLAQKMGEPFPELVRNRDYVERVIRAEEENFLETLGTGISFFERILPYLKELAGNEEIRENGQLEKVLKSLKADHQTFGLLEKAYGGVPR